MTNVVLTSYFTGQVDPQRGVRLESDTEALAKLTASIQEPGALVVLNDCWLSTNANGFAYERVEAPEPAYRQRWLSQWQWLRRHREVEWVWLVDATDVVQLRDPWQGMEHGILYCGWEPHSVGCQWMRKTGRMETDWIRRNARLPLLNCGVVGGDRATVMELCMRMNDHWARTQADALHEMTFFNMSARAMNFRTGPSITTEFKKYQDNGEALWRHK
jgi:hypothetical protein